MKTGIVEAPSVRVGFRTLVSLALCAVAAGAAMAHVAIDVVGDYALTADSYDHLRHGSRDVVSAVALVLAVVLAARGLRLCCEIASLNRSRILLRVPGRREAVGFVASSVAACAVLVPAMEWFDGRLDGVPVRALDDAFGGSLLLGLGTTVLCATLVALVVYCVARWLISHRDSIATIIETLLRPLAGAVRPSSYDLSLQLFTPRRRRTPDAFRLSKRGPPRAIFA
jgi:hypothetical protein